MREFDALCGHKHFRCRILERETTKSSSENDGALRRRLDCGGSGVAVVSDSAAGVDPVTF